jgi:hypothetical protein
MDTITALMVANGITQTVLKYLEISGCKKFKGIIWLRNIPKL